MVSKKKRIFFFFTFPNWENQTWYWKKRWLFLIGNGAEIRPLEMCRKGPAGKVENMMVADLYLYSALFMLLIIEICVHVVCTLRTSVLTSFLFDWTY